MTKLETKRARGLSRDLERRGGDVFETCRQHKEMVHMADDLMYQVKQHHKDALRPEVAA